MAGKQVIHMAPPASRVPTLMRDLLAWLRSTREHPLIASAVFHYEFEFIHPFADGNGRMGRLWQSLILSQWQSVFAQIPVESLIYEHQQAYYDAIRQSTQNADSAVFIEFMLEMISKALPASTPPSQPASQPASQPPSRRTDSRARWQDGARANSSNAGLARSEIVYRTLPETRARSGFDRNDTAKPTYRPFAKIPAKPQGRTFA